jgi:hypothetical protein
MGEAAAAAARRYAWAVVAGEVAEVYRTALGDWGVRGPQG